MDDTPFFVELRQVVASKGGFLNAHLHLDRAGTIKVIADERASEGLPTDISSLSLMAKHRLIPAIHESREYDPERLRARVEFFLDQMVLAGTRRAETLRRHRRLSFWGQSDPWVTPVPGRGVHRKAATGKGGPPCAARKPPLFDDVNQTRTGSSRKQ